MSPQRKAIAFWLAVGAVGFLAIPWYALQESILSSAWLRHYSAREYAPALLQALRHGRIWLLAIGALLLFAAPLLASGISRRLRACALLFVGAAGFVVLTAQGFAIGSQGWAFDALARTFGPLATGQYGMGWGATLAATSFAMLFALGLAESGRFNGEAFIASSVVAIALSVAIFTFFPVVTILASAFEDGNGAI